MKTTFLTFAAAAFVLAAHAEPVPGDNATMTAGLGPNGGNIVVEAHGVQPQAPLFFGATVENVVHAGVGEVTGEMKVKLVVLQGRPEVLTLGLSGSGDVVDVTGAGLGDWAVRQGGAGGARFLDLHPALDPAKPAPKELDVVVHTRLRNPPVPGSVAILIATPGNAVGFSSQTTLTAGPDVDLRITDASGMMPIGTPDGPGRIYQFQSGGGASLTVALLRRGAAVAVAELTGAQLTGKLDEAGKSVAFRLQGQARVSAPNARLRLLSGRAALGDSASGDGWHVELAPDGDGFAYELVFDRAGQFPIDLTFSAAVRENGESHAVDFKLAAGVVVPLEIDGLPAKVEFDPAAPVVPGPAPQGWRGFLPADGHAAFAWKPARDAGEGALFFTGDERTDVRVAAGLLNQSSQITLHVLQGKMSGVSLQLDGPGEILSVEGDNVVGWKVLPMAQQRILEVRLSRPIEAQATFVVRSQTALGAFPVTAQPMRLTPQGVVRHSGYIRVSNEGAVRLGVAGLSGLMQLSPEQFPGDALPDTVRQVFVYRFPSASYDYRITADQIMPEINVSQIATYQIAETDRVIEADIQLDIREAPVRDWSMTVPADYAVVSVTGATVADYAPDAAAPGGARALKIYFSGAVDGRQLIHLRLEKNESAAAGQWQLPPLGYPGAKTVRGQIGVVAIPGYRVTPVSARGLVEVPVSYFPNQTAGMQQAYRLRDATWSAAMGIEALGQSVQADVFHLYSLKEGVVYGSVLINYLVVGAPANEWRISVPRGVGNIDVIGQNVRREWRREGDQIVIPLHQPVLGPATLLVSFEEPMSARGGVIDPGEVQPLGVQEERGYIQVVSPLQVKFDVRKTAGPLLKLEPLELPAEFRLLTTAPTLAAYQYTGRPFGLEMNVQWYPPAETAVQVVDFAKLSSEVSRDGQVVTDARLFVKTRGQQALQLVLPAGAKIWDARVDDEVVNARADGDRTLIPLPPRSNPNEPAQVLIRIGQSAANPSRPLLTAPVILAPAVMIQWTLQSDPGRLLAPRGGNAELRSSSLTENGFEWLTARGRAGSLLMLASIALAGALLRRGNGSRLTAGLLAAAAAIAIAVFLANFALTERRVNSRSLTYLATMVRDGDPVTIEVANLPPWRAEISWWGVAAAAAGLGLAASALARRADDGAGRAVRLAVGMVLASLGLLAQAGGAILFFSAVALAVLLFVFVPGFRRMIGSRRGAAKSGGPLPGAAYTPLIAAAAGLAMLLPGASRTHAANPFQGGAKPAESIVQTWKIQKGRLYGEADVRLRGLAGESFLLLTPPAVLTGFQGDGLRTGKVERDGRTAYYVAPLRDGTFSGHATFEMPAPDLSAGIPLPTGAAAVQRVSIDLDEPGWQFASDAAASIQHAQGIARGDSGATLLLSPSGDTTIRLVPQTRDVDAETTQFYAELANLYVPGPGVVNGWHRVTVRSAQGRVSELEFDVPKGLTVGDVKNGPVGLWRFDPVTRKLRVSVEPAQTGAFKFDIESQLGIDALPANVTLEPIRITGAAGEIGTIGLAFGSDAQAGMLQPKNLSPLSIEDFDSSLIPSGRDGQPLAVLQQVYRYGPAGGSVSLAVESVAPEVRVATRQVLSLGDDRLVMAVDLNVDITRAGIFSLSFALPEGLEVEALTGASLSQWTEAEEAGGRVVTMHLTGRTIGSQTFALTLSGAGPHAQPAWVVPKFQVREATRQSGEILLVPEQGIRLRPIDRENVTQLDPQAEGETRPGVVALRVLGQDYKLSVAVEMLDPWVTARALQEVTLREGQTLTRLAVHYRVENAAVKELRVRLPGLGDEESRTARATGSAVADFTRVAGTPDEWEIRFQRGIIGDTGVRIEFQGQSARSQGNEDVRMPILEGARQAVLFVAVRASGRLDVAAGETPAGWQRVDWTSVPDDLQDPGDRSVPALCFTVAEPEGPLVVAVHRHDLADALKVRVTAADLTTVFSPRGPSLTAAVLNLEVVEKSTLRVRLPESAQLINTFVNNESAQVVRDEDSYLFNVSPATDQGHAATIRLVYAVPEIQGRRITLCGPALGVPMEHVSWRIVAPAGYRAADFRGDLELERRESAGIFGLADYQSFVVSSRATESKTATDLLHRANALLQSGDEQQAGEALDRAAKTSGLNAAENEDARVELRVLKTQQAMLGLNTRRQKLYLDNRADVQRNEQLEQAANLNPFLQGRMNYDPQQVDQMLQGNTAEENSALNEIAGRLVDQQLAAEPAPAAIDVTMPVRGEVLNFTRSMQVNGDAPLRVELELRPLGHADRGFIALVMLAIGVIAATALSKTPVTQA